VETQQQSDTTYRLYDYGRPRELHLKEGLAVMKEEVASGKVVRPAPSPIDGTKNLKSPLIAAPNFVVDRFELKQPQDFRAEPDAANSVRILVAVDGCGVVEVRGAEPVTLAKGDAVVVPACFSEFRVRPQWALEFLQAYVPGVGLPEPVTRM
jgi:mannose-6-phosphate isomerase